MEEFAGQLQRRFDCATDGEKVVGVMIAYSAIWCGSDIFASSSLFKTDLAEVIAQLRCGSTVEAWHTREKYSVS